MAVVASFTAIPEVGLSPPSDSVQFTDTSTGNPDRWLWDFGDGTMSSEQNPVHTYTGSTGDAFTPTLTAWIFGAKTTQSPGVNRFEKQFGPGPFTFADFIGFSWTAVSGSISRVYLGAQAGATFGARKIEITINPAQESPPVVYIAEAVYNNQWIVSASNIDVFAGVLEARISTGGTLKSAVGFSDLGVPLPVADITGLGSAVYTFDFGNVDPLQPWPDRSGFNCNITIEKYTVSSADDIDSTSGSILFGFPPVAAFDAEPTEGPDPLPVQFENLSTPAVGAPTTYSWKSRIAGSGDAFVEFSTEENPLKVFSK